MVYRPPALAEKVAGFRVKLDVRDGHVLFEVADRGRAADQSTSGRRSSSQASATWAGVQRSRAAVAATAGLAWTRWPPRAKPEPSGKNGTKAMPRARHAQADDYFAATGFRADGTVNRAYLLAWSGREDELHAALAGIANLADWFGQGHLLEIGRHALAVLDLGLGRYQSALDHALPVFRDDPPAVGNLVLPLIVEAGVRAGQREAAAAALARMAERAPAAGPPWGLGLLARCQALLSSDEHAEARYRESLELLSQVPVALDLAHTRLLFGEWLRRRKRRGEARSHLRVAHQHLNKVFRKLGISSRRQIKARLGVEGQQDRE